MGRYEDHIEARKRRRYEAELEATIQSDPFLSIHVEDDRFTITIDPEELKNKKELDKIIYKDANSKRNAPSNEELITLYTTGKGNKDYMVDLNCKIDTIFYNGLYVDRYRRECLSCGEVIIGHGKFNRMCYCCSTSALRNLDNFDTI